MSSRNRRNPGVYMGGLLPRKALDAIVRLAMRCDRLDPAHRELLLEDISRALRASLPEHRTPYDQLRSDLTLLNRALDAPPAIVTWLWAAARSTPDLDCRLEFLTHAQDAAERWWDEHNADDARPMEPSRLRPGDLFDGRFQLIRLLSDGHFSVVWQVQDTKTHQTRALKMHKHLLDGRGRRRLRRGAEHLLQLSHPNLVRVFDLVDPADESRPLYYWMEYLPGGDLHRAIIEGRRVGRAAIRTIIDAAEGLAASHEIDVWHRDFRPENILLGADGRARLADFDLLQPMETSEDTGRVSSVAFAAPEAIADLSLADHRADIFGVGRSVQFVLFADAHPDLEPTALCQAWARSVVGQTAPEALRCSTELAEVLARATDPDPERRHPSVRALLRDLREALDEDGTRLGRRFVVGALIGDEDGRAVHDGTDTLDGEPEHGGAPVRVDRFAADASARIDAAFPKGRWLQLDLGLCHPHVLAVQARGRDHQGLYWQVSQHHGAYQPLATALAERVDGSIAPLDVLAATGRWLTNLVDALAHAHNRGVTHNRLAARHVFVSADGAALAEWTFADRGGGPRALAADLRALGAVFADACAVLDALRADRIDAQRTIREATAHAIRASIAALRRIAGACDDGSLGRVGEAADAIGRWCATTAARGRLVDAERQKHLAMACEARAREAALLARRSLLALPPGASADDKAAAWDEEDRAARLAAEARSARSRWLADLEELAGLLPAARQQLIGALLDDLAAADHLGERGRAARIEERLARYSDDERVCLALAASSPITVRWRADGTRITLARYSERRRRMMVAEPIALGDTGEARLSLRRGDYRVSAVTPTGQQASWPLHIARDNGGGERIIRLMDEHLHRIRPGEAYIPAGPCVVGGGDEAIDAVPRLVVSIAAFAMMIRPVTHESFLEFLAHLIAAGRTDEAERFVPRKPMTIRGEMPPALYMRRGSGPYALPPNADVDRRHPVSGVTWFAASAYADFLAATTDLPWRLPRELEWEKAARGIDGRACPCGPCIDACFGNVVNSRDGLAAPVTVDDYPTYFPDDVSPYGVEGLAGNMRAWCSERWRRLGPRLQTDAHGLRRMAPIDEAEPDDETLMVVRGAAWSTAAYHMRSANRYADRAGWHPTTAGIRLVRSLD